VSSVFNLPKFSHFVGPEKHDFDTCKGFEGHAATTKVPCDRHGSVNLENQLQEISLQTLPKAPPNFFEIFSFCVFEL
jgi:hypothetical protein